MGFPRIIDTMWYVNNSFINYCNIIILSIIDTMWYVNELSKEQQLQRLDTYYRYNVVCKLL